MDKVEKDNQWLLWLLIAIVIFVIFASWYFIDSNIPCNETRGQFGDKFGSVNALFSGLAFAGLIYTIVLQRKDLQLQKKDLEQTRKELEGQKEEAKKQNATLLKQEFNSIFFNLLKVNRDMIESIQVSSFDGQQALRHLYKRFKENVASTGKTDEDIKCEYEKIYNFNREFFSYYFRSLFRLISIVDRTEVITRFEKYDYLNIVFSQLSDYEIVFIFYDCSCRFTDNNMKNLIEGYSLFNRFPKELLILSTHKDRYYDKIAFSKGKINYT